MRGGHQHFPGVDTERGCSLWEDRAASASCPRTDPGRWGAGPGGRVIAAPALPGNRPHQPRVWNAVGVTAFPLHLRTPTAPKSIPDPDQATCAQAAAGAELMGCECQGCCLGPDEAGGQGKVPPLSPPSSRLTGGSGREEGCGARERGSCREGRSEGSELQGQTSSGCLHPHWGGRGLQALISARV